DVRTRASVILTDGQQEIEEGTEEELLLKLLKHQRWSSANATVRCFKCKKLVVTDVVFVPTVRTYIVSLALFLTGIFSVLCLIPFYYPELLGVELHALRVLKPGLPDQAWRELRLDVAEEAGLTAVAGFNRSTL
uniref:LITAF domain-containing protein n=1 Tax=Macrostomum lignano TaxID=282301 RepID=A0A1I8FTW4_9PLAT